MNPICEDSRSLLPLAVVCATALALGQASDTPLYRDPSKPIEARIRDLVGRLTIEEKAQQLNHLNKGLPRLGIKAWGGWNQTLHGVWSKEPTTLFPMPTAMGATWDPDLVHQVADAMSDEARALYNAGKDGPRSPHGLVYRSPVINISRDPRWGRIQEVFSEDPYLTGRMAVAYVRGLQGKDIAHLKVAATVKHFAVNNVEAGRQHLSAIVDERNLYDYWFPHWKAAFVEGKAQSVMSSYNAINGVPSAVNRWLLTDVLRRQWGFDGFVTDDLGAVQLLTSERPNEPGHRFSDDPVVSTAAAIKAGNDSDDQEFEDNIPKAVQRGLLTVADVDRALSNVLRVGFRLGAFDPSTPYDAIPMSVVRNPDHLALSLQVAQKSLTLLSNRSSGPGTAPAVPPVAFLPLKREETRSIAVIGPAGDQDYPTGNYYGTPARKVGVVQGLREVLGDGVTIDYEKGADFVGPADADAVARAVALAKRSDVVVLCLGTGLRVEAESRDRRDLNLPGAQQPLLEAVFAANPRVALVLFNAGPLAVTWAHDQLPAILAAWFPGEAGGIAVARALFGVDNPGGKLPYTVYANLDGVPSQNEYDVSKGYTYQYFKGVPLYPFGHGLSYTRFRFSNLTLSASSIAATGEVQVAFDVTNVGDRAGDEVAQLYTHQTREQGLPAASHAAGLPPRHAAAERDDARHVHAAGVAARLVPGRNHRVGGRARRVRHRRRRVVRQHPAARLADGHRRAPGPVTRRGRAQRRRPSPARPTLVEERRTPRIESVRHGASRGSAIRLARAGGRAGCGRRRHPVAGARHRRQQRDLQRRQPAAPQPAALRRSRSPRHPLEPIAGPGHRRGLVLHRAVLRHPRHRRLRRRRARHRRQRQPDRRRRAGTHRHDPGVVEPAADARRPSRARPPVHRRRGSRRRRGHGAAGARHLAAALRRGSVRRRPVADRERRLLSHRRRAAGRLHAAARRAADARRRRAGGAAAAAAARLPTRRRSARARTTTSSRACRPASRPRRPRRGWTR